MAFTVETGTNVANSNAYIDEVFFGEFHDDRGTDINGCTSKDIQRAIIKATDYVDKRFGMRYVGCPANRTQSLSWPRNGAEDRRGIFIQSDEVPLALKRAVAEYAILALRITNLLPTPANSFATIGTDGAITRAEGAPIARTFEKVGPIEEEAWFHDPAKANLLGRAAGASSNMVSSMNLPEYPVADEWLSTIVNAGTPTRIARA